MRFHTTLGFILLLTLMGCQTTAGSLSDANRQKVTFISFPPGAVLEINGVYQGRTPNVIELDADPKGPIYEVFVYPMEDDSYWTKNTILRPDELPSEVSFDLTQCEEHLDTEE